MGLAVRPGWLAAAAVALISLSACNAPAPPPAPSTVAAPPDPWPQFSAHFLEAYFKANPFFAVHAGRHEFDGQMPDLSAAGIAAELTLLRQLRTQAQGFDAALPECAGAPGARAAVHRDRQRSFLARARASALHQPGLVHRSAGP